MQFHSPVITRYAGRLFKPRLDLHCIMVINDYKERWQANYSASCSGFERELELPSIIVNTITRLLVVTNILINKKFMEATRFKQLTSRCGQTNLHHLVRCSSDQCNDYRAERSNPIPALNKMCDYAVSGLTCSFCTLATALGLLGWTPEEVTEGHPF